MRRVLLVEDDASVAAGIAALLDADGYQVHVVHAGLQAVDAVEEFGPAVVVLDVRLHDIDGSVVFRMLRDRWSDLPVIFSSGHVHDLAEVGAANEKRVALLRKPYDGSTLVEAIEAVASSPGASEQETP